MTCYERQHMTPAEYGLWEYARTVSHASGVFYLDCRKTQAEFSGTSKSTIYRLAGSLQQKGFFVLLREPQRTARGTKTAKEYRPLSHEEWAAQHPNVTCPARGTSHVPETGQVATCPKIEGSLSQNRVSPVPPVGRSLVFKSGNESLDKPSRENPRGAVLISPEFELIEPPKPSTKSDPRHAATRVRILELHQESFGITSQWDGREGRELDRLLKANPSWSQDDLTRMVESRFQSEAITPDRPAVWLARLGTYAVGPLDRYGKLASAERLSPAMARQQRNHESIARVIFGVDIGSTPGTSPRIERQNRTDERIANSILKRMGVDIYGDTNAPVLDAGEITALPGVTTMAAALVIPTPEPAVDAPASSPAPPRKPPDTFAEFAKRATRLWCTVQPKSFRAFTQTEQSQLTLQWARTLQDDSTYKRHHGHVWPIGMDKSGNLRVVFASQEIADEAWPNLALHLVRAAHDWNPAIQIVHYMAPRTAA
jgi:hypothetical protein